MDDKTFKTTLIKVLNKEFNKCGIRLGFSLDEVVALLLCCK